MLYKLPRTSNPLPWNTSHFPNIATSFAFGSSDSAPQLRPTLAQLRFELNACIAQSSMICPDAVPTFCAMNALLAAAASQEIEYSLAENRRELRRVLTQLSQQLSRLTSAHSPFSLVVQPLLALGEPPEFY